ncbi:MAG: Nif3-like dinuclear metal center hexameric protein [Lentimicrobium sp.]|nr:Nif3-like dinuclear metal center hexameric protein [Lentimicrobium sp.]
MIISEIVRHIESIAPLSYQESYDNSGLLIGNQQLKANGALFTLDVTEAVVDEAIDCGYNLIIAHHPLIFRPIKQITGNTEVERCIIKAIKNDVVIYAAHTNLDNAPKGVNAMICNKLGLNNVRILASSTENLRKLVVFVPQSHAYKVREAMFEAGAGRLGNYDSCSFNIEGNGTFRAGKNANPYIGSKGEMHFEAEVRVEVLCETYNQSQVIDAMNATHPYEEVAFDVYPLLNENHYVGSGMTGEFSESMDEMTFLKKVKSTFGPGCLKYSPLISRKIKKVAVCGGSGNFLISKAKASGADAFITGELKYHDYFLAENNILLVEAGHYETEQFTKELLNQIIKEKFTTFATRISTITTNPINYL